MHRFFLAPEKWNTPCLDAMESHHALHVLRLAIGARLTIFDGVGSEALATIASTDGNRAHLDVRERTTQSPPTSPVTLVQGIPKGKAMDLVVQKAVELGVAAIVPILSERSVVQLDTSEALRKRDKWATIALEACKQCGQNFLPHIETPQSLEKFFSTLTASDLILIASLQPDARPLRTALESFTKFHRRNPTSIIVLIGPEGDFTPAELTLAKSCGAQPVTLGPIILRSETASIYSLSVLSYFYQQG